MTKNRRIRLADKDDASSILQIYAPYITGTAITFECEVPTVEAFSDRMKNIQRVYPWLVCEIDDHIAGYAYASRYMERQAYDWSADFSIYINPQYHGKRIGKSLYFSLIEILKLQGYYNIYSAVTMPNIKSESLHESFGFNEIGIFRNVGYKLGGWHDVKWYVLKINEHIQSPVKPKKINEIADTDEFRSVIKKAEQMIMD